MSRLTNDNPYSSAPRASGAMSQAANSTSALAMAMSSMHRPTKSFRAATGSVSPQTQTALMGINLG